SLFSPSLFYSSRDPLNLHSFPTRRSSDLDAPEPHRDPRPQLLVRRRSPASRDRVTRQLRQRHRRDRDAEQADRQHLDQLGIAERSEEHTSELQSRSDLVCRLLLEKKKKTP